MASASKSKNGERAAKPERQRKAAKGGQGRRPFWPLAVAIVGPALLVGGVMLYHSSDRFAGGVDGLAARTRGFIQNLFEGPDKGADRRAVPPPREEDPRSAETRSPEEEPLLTVPTAPEPGGPAPTRLPPVEIPRQQTVAATAAVTPLSVRQAGKVARAIFGGKIADSRSRPQEPWHHFTMAGAERRHPFALTPGEVRLGITALSGPFIKEKEVLLVTLAAREPEGQEWTNEYIGAVLLSGTPNAPGKVLGATAMQAPRGAVTRLEAIDIQADGVAELALEIESEGPGGYLFRDLAVHSFGDRGTKILWSARTLDDGPGVPLDTARFKNVTFVDEDGDGRLDVRVESGKRRYRVGQDFSRKLRKEEVQSVRTFRFERGKFRLAQR